ncbi:hypothetical protein WH47_08448 [Habropoda laboriosa]|uniref:Uncharacterized protein n=1 Tax=Habropoda laboriosa TaxID=597456 RepID=A0A0L7QP73_9HYME|nr:hypothetical protein WH47_08448 [Habropoda laboriosa]
MICADELIEDVLLNVHETMWYQYDGCSAPYSRAATQVLNRKFPNRWIGRDDRISWLTCSLDLTPLGIFHLQKLIKDVY